MSACDLQPQIGVLDVVEVPPVGPQHLQVLGAPVLPLIVLVVGHEAAAVGARVVVKAQDVADLVGEHISVALKMTGMVFDHDVGAARTSDAVHIALIPPRREADDQISFGRAVKRPQFV